MYTVVMLRHGESLWNQENRFTGWEDVPLSQNGVFEARNAAQSMKEKLNFSFDIAFTSVLKRAIKTLDIVLEELDQLWIPVHKSWRLNERHYGTLQGLNKQDTIDEFGLEQVQKWRRSYSEKPPLFDFLDSRNPSFEAKYKNLKKEELPIGESLEQTISRCVPFLREELEPQILNNKHVLIVAHGNSLRALVKYWEGMRDEEIVNFEMPTGVPLVYLINDDLTVKGRYFLQESFQNVELNF